MLVVVVAVPALRRDALGRRGLRHRVPDVDVLELRPHLEVRVRDVEETLRGHGPEPRIRGPELHAVALQSHDELLARPNPDVLAARGEIGLRRGDEAVALLLDLTPQPGVGEDVLEGPDGVPLLADVGQDALLEIVQLRRRLAEVPSACAVREEVVVQLVGRADPLALDCLRHAVGAVSEDTIHAAGELRSLPVHSPLG